ncbi:MAG: ATPase [Betaproteobacteria bacterium]|jgi:V/A-type H+-transporting ATPase subunit I|nr:ATPase [Betaproteobacteria bacterium]
MIRPQPARWFEALTPRDDATLALAALAATGAVELEEKHATDLPESLVAARPLLVEFANLAARYRAYWPSAGLAPSAFPEAPNMTLARTIEQIGAWAPEAEPTIVALQRAEADLGELGLWRRVLEGMGRSLVDLSRLADAGPLVETCLGVFPLDAVPAAPPTGLVRTVALDDARYAVLVGTGEDLSHFHQQAAALKGRIHEIPAWLRPTVPETLEYVAERAAELDDAVRGLRGRLEELNRAHHLHRAIGDADRLQWVTLHVRALDCTDCFARVTGWTSEANSKRLLEALSRSGARSLLHFAAPPRSATAPLLLVNPWWARPFEIFSRALGMPASYEADPTVLLAVTVPLMFGYMFGDLGQGLVLAVGAFLLRKRFPIARLFVAGGLSAAAFGIAFGSVFSIEHLLHPLWLSPLAEPLVVLAVPLVFGAGLLVLGQLFNAIEAYWRGRFGHWLAVDAGQLITYLGILGGFLEPLGFAVAGAAFLFACAGGALVEKRVAAFFTTMGELVERTIQLLVNTLSFARVGAFALAHAGLSAAIMALMESSDNAALRALVLVLGNVVVLALETLVVAIQTTRLVLFEFFTKFLVAEGRPFRPLPVPPFMPQESQA